MLASKTSSRNVSRRPRKARSMKAIYNSQRPSGVSSDDWSTVFDAFLVEWGRSLAADVLQRVAPPRSERAA